MEIHLPPDLQARLNQAAAENGCGAAAYAERIIERYFDYDAWFRQKVDKGIDSLNRGEFLTHEAVGDQIERMFDS